MKTNKLIGHFENAGDELIIHIPQKIIEHFKIKPGDFSFFEERSDGILIKPISAKKLKA